MPRIAKIGESTKSQFFQAGEIVYIINEKRNFEQENVIQLDNKVASYIEVGDEISFENSKIRLKVLESDKANPLFDKKVSTKRRIPKQSSTKKLKSLFDKQSRAEEPEEIKKTKTEKMSAFKHSNTSNFEEVLHKMIRSDRKSLGKEEVDVKFEKEVDHYENELNFDKNFLGVKKEENFSGDECISSNLMMKKSKVQIDKTAKTKHRHSDDIDRPAFRKNLTSKTITSINKRLKNMLACEVIEGGIAKEAFKVYVKGKDLISRLDLKCVSSKEVVDVSKGTENVST